jgi:hypothetical protein
MTIMYRKINEVLPRILKEIPEEETLLIEQLIEYTNSLWNKAPEIMTTPEVWIPVGNILKMNIRELNKDWKIRVHKIFMNEI